MIEADERRTTTGAAISVIIPSYNPGAYLRDALESALHQLGPDDEIVVQDAGSTDGSQDLLADLARTDPRVKTVVEQDYGQSDALNRALRRVVNPWVLWLNADDLVLDSAIGALRDVIDGNPDLDVVMGASQVVRADGSTVDTYAGKPLSIPAMVAGGCAAFSGSILMRTSFLSRIGGFETDLHTVMDLSLQLRMAAADPRQAVIATPVGALRFHEASKSANLWREFVRESHAVRMRHADGARQQSAARMGTLTHIVAGPLFRLRLTPAYRNLRRLVRRGVVR
jgi:GT2 family glycosyltransferase